MAMDSVGNNKQTLASILKKAALFNIALFEKDLRSHIRYRTLKCTGEPVKSFSVRHFAKGKTKQMCTGAVYSLLAIREK